MNHFGLHVITLIFMALTIWVSCSNASRQISGDDKTADRLAGKSAPMRHTREDQHPLDGPRDPSMHWSDSRPPQVAEGVALVIHGLNLRPSKMEPIVGTLTDSGIDALNLSLRGHGQNYERRTDSEPARARLAAFKTVTYPLWRNEVHAAYTAAKNRSMKKNVPLFLIGYSLGGLLGVDLLATEPGVQFDKMVLFAPALKMHLRNYLIRVLAPFSRLTIPSFALASYQSNDGTPMAGYNALFDSLNSVTENIGPRVNVPTLVFVDRKDEIVSYRRLKMMVQDEGLDQWQFYLVHKESSVEPGRIHHLIIDEPSTGEKVWLDMMAAMVSHLHN
jgi:esterase/lipase